MSQYYFELKGVEGCDCFISLVLAGQKRKFPHTHIWCSENQSIFNSALTSSFFVMDTCWFATLRAPWEKSKTGPHSWRTGRDQRKKQSTPDWQVEVLIIKRTYILGFSWAAARQCNCCTCLPESESLYRCLHWVQSCIHSRWSQQHLLLSRQCPQRSLFQCGNSGQNIQWASGGSMEPPVAWVQLMVQLPGQLWYLPLDEFV